MKKTNMHYQETFESQRLADYVLAGVDYEFTKKYIEPTILSLKRRKYNKDRAIDKWYNVATQAAHRDKATGYIYSMNDRFTAAIKAEEHYRKFVFE